MSPAEDLVQVTLTRRQAERLHDLLTIGGIRGFGVSGAKERIRTALEAGGITYDWDTIKANLLRKDAAKHRGAQSGCSERPPAKVFGPSPLEAVLPEVRLALRLGILDSAPEPDESVKTQEKS